MGRFKGLPHWCMTDTIPSAYDVESKTAIKMVARLYASYEDLVKDYNNYIDEINKAIVDFETGVITDETTFKETITKIVHDYIKMIDDKVKIQDATIAEAVDYMKNNIANSINEVVEEMKESGELAEVVVEGVNDAVARITTLEESMNNVNTMTERIPTIEESLSDISTRIEVIPTIEENLSEIDVRTETNSNDILNLDYRVKTIESVAELVIFGDSWSDANVTNSIWGAIIGNKLGLTVNNYAKSSAYMSGTDDISLQSQVTQFLDSSVDKTKVKYIVILGGINDFRNSVTYSTLVTALTDQITRLESVCPKAKIVYISNTQYPYTESQGVYWSGVHQSLRINTQITTLNLFNIMGRKAFDSGYFHLTQDGYRLLASNIISLLTGGEILEYQDLVLLTNGSHSVKYFTQRVGNVVHVGFSIYINYGGGPTEIIFSKETSDPNLSYAGSMAGSFMTNGGKVMEYLVSNDNIKLTFNSAPSGNTYIKVSKVLPLYNPGLPY